MKMKKSAKRSKHYKRREANTGRGKVRWEPPPEALIELNLLPDTNAQKRPQG